MSVAEVLRHDLLVLRESKLSWAVFLALAGTVSLPFLAIVTDTGGANAAVRGQLVAAGAVAFVVPILAMAPCLFVLAKERESDTIRFLLSQPNDRSDVVVGKALSRTGLVYAGLCCGFLVVALGSVALAGAAHLVSLLLLTVLTLLFAGCYVGLAVGVSAWASSQTRAVVGTAGAYLLFTVAWLPYFPVSVSRKLVGIAESVAGGTLSPATVRLIELVNPLVAYGQALQVLGPTFENAARAYSSTNTLAAPGTALAALVAWTFVPLVLGYLSFARADLG